MSKKKSNIVSASDELQAIEAELDEAMGVLDDTNLRIGELLQGMDAPQAVPDDGEAVEEEVAANSGESAPE